MKKRLFPIFLIFVFILTAGAGCQFLGDPAKDPTRPITLEYWRVFDGKGNFDEIIKEYNKKHPNIRINYRKIRYEDYKKELLNAMAEDRGPDIFSIHNTWMKEYQSKLLPMPDQVTMGELVTEGTLQKETVIKKRVKDTMRLKELENKFIDVVYDDMIMKNENEEEKIYGLPLAVDTLAMYYNKDLFNNAGVSTPPAYWDREFQKTVKKLTKQNSKGKIVQSGVGMGGGSNINRAPDILSALMMQNKADMMTENGVVLFHTSSREDGGYNPGLEALRFYTDFANPAKEVYCWNDDMDNSLKEFMEGNLAMIFGYSHNLPTIKSEAPKLNFNIAPLPQIKNSSREINYANYWAEVVSKKTEEKDAAWDFLMFATQKEQAQKYLDNTNKPTALRDLVEKQKEDKEIGVFANQLLTAKSWYRGYDALTMEKIMTEMINEASNNPKEMDKIISRGATRIRQTAEK